MTQNKVKHSLNKNLIKDFFLFEMLFFVLFAELLDFLLGISKHFHFILVRDFSTVEWLSL